MMLLNTRMNLPSHHTWKSVTSSRTSPPYGRSGRITSVNAFCGYGWMRHDNSSRNVRLSTPGEATVPLAASTRTTPSSSHQSVRCHVTSHRGFQSSLTDKQGIDIENKRPAYIALVSKKANGEGTNAGDRD
jgi:hypothetical protein